MTEEAKSVPVETIRETNTGIKYVVAGLVTVGASVIWETQRVRPWGVDAGIAVATVIGLILGCAIVGLIASLIVWGGRSLTGQSGGFGSGARVGMVFVMPIWAVASLLVNTATKDMIRERVREQRVSESVAPNTSRKVERKAVEVDSPKSATPIARVRPLTKWHLAVINIGLPAKPQVDEESQDSAFKIIKNYSCNAEPHYLWATISYKKKWSGKESAEQARLAWLSKQHAKGYQLRSVISRATTVSGHSAQRMELVIDDGTDEYSTQVLFVVSGPDCLTVAVWGEPKFVSLNADRILESIEVVGSNPQ